MSTDAGGKSALSAGLGVCVLVRGEVVAWFAEFTEESREWCTENYFGEWLTWRGMAPTPIPLTPEEQADCERRGREIAAHFKEPRIAD